MHHANHFYGHANVMARYCGLPSDSSPRISGYLQHGWNIGDGLGPGTPYVRHTPIFVWSDQTRRRALASGRPNVVTVGAPWAYLRHMRAADTAPPRVGTIWYPFHGYEAQEVTGDHKRLIAEIHATETEPVTVCLYWYEYRNRRIRRYYERAGFTVVCHGYRGFWWRDTDPHFLDRQLALLRGFKRVASNRVSSALLYGISAGCAPAVYGDPMVLEDEDTEYGGFARVVRQWPELSGPDIDVETATRIAESELGADALLSPEELTELFGWATTREKETSR